MSEIINDLITMAGDLNLGYDGESEGAREYLRGQVELIASLEAANCPHLGCDTDDHRDSVEDRILQKAAIKEEARCPECLSIGYHKMDCGRRR